MTRNRKSNRMNRSFRVESLERRELMSGTPWQPLAPNPPEQLEAAAALTASQSPASAGIAAQPWYEFEASKLKVHEGQAYIELTVYRRGVGPQDDNVYWTTRNSTAILRERDVPYDDYNHKVDWESNVGRVLKFRGGDHVESFLIAISDDEIPEPTEHFKVFLLSRPDDESRLRDPSNILAQATVTVVDNEIGRWVGDAFVVDAAAGANRLHITKDSASGFPVATLNGVSKTLHHPNGLSSFRIKFNGGAGNDVVINDTGLSVEAYGNGGNDFLRGGSGADVLVGGAGNDRLYGGMSNDQMSGGDGDDQLHGDDGADIVKGDVGNDYVVGGAGHDLLHGGDGIDNLRGGIGNDAVFGGNGDDWVIGDEGSDRLYGENGNDQVYGNDGFDFLFGGQGFDYLFGGAGDDYADGGTEDDYLDGGAGHDVLRGGTGRDKVFGREGNDWLYGGLDNDELYGGLGADVLYGNQGADRLDGEAGNDLVYGDEGNDLIVSRDGVVGNDSLYGGLGDDEFDAPLVEIKQR